MSVIFTNEASARYACLELRFAIEYLVYEQARAHKDEIADATLRSGLPTGESLRN
jgi:hypothetical protein